jgi:hypothetical protein
MPAIVDFSASWTLLGIYLSSHTCSSNTLVSDTSFWRTCRKDLQQQFGFAVFRTALAFCKKAFLDITLCAYSDVITYVIGTGNIFRATAIQRQLPIHTYRLETC